MIHAERLVFLGLLVVSSGAVLGCGADPDDDPQPDPYARPITGVRDGHLSGEVGWHPVDQDAETLGVFIGELQLVVFGAVEFENHAVMLQLTVTTEEELLVPGVNESVTYSDGPRLRLLACTGQSIGVYDEYEATADQLTLVVEQASDEAAGDGPDGATTDGAGDVRATVTGTWSRPHADPPEDPRTAALTFIVER